MKRPFKELRPFGVILSSDGITIGNRIKKMMRENDGESIRGDKIE